MDRNPQTRALRSLEFGLLRKLGRPWGPVRIHRRTTGRRRRIQLWFSCRVRALLQPAVGVRSHFNSTTPDGVLTEGDWSAVGITDLHVTFSEQMRTSDDPAEPGIVTDASNWLLVSAGSDGLIQTASCSHGLAHDDTALVLNGLAYNSQTQTLSLHANEGTPLTNGRLRFVRCGTLRSSIRVLLDGDQDGNAEENDDFSLRFSIDSTAPANPIVSATFPRGQRMVRRHHRRSGVERILG
jgi:hypothetical protein